MMKKELVSIILVLFLSCEELTKEIINHGVEKN